MHPVVLPPQMMPEGFTPMPESYSFEGYCVEPMGMIGNAIQPKEMAEHTPSICLMLSEHWRYVEL